MVDPGRVERPVRIVIAGVSGSGKSTVGRLVADALGACFVDGDDLHPTENVEKMAAGAPLDDRDRQPWLLSVADALAGSDRIVVACSALRRRYRDALRAPGDVQIAVLDVPMERAAERVADRPSHFMPVGLVADQFASLERPTGAESAAYVVDATAPLATVVHEVLARVGSEAIFSSRQEQDVPPDQDVQTVFDFDSSLCTYTVADGVATIAFNRPEQMNGMTGDMEVAYFGRLRQAEADPDVRVIVVTGTGRGFCPGADLAHRAGEGQQPLPNQLVSTRTPLEIDKPMIAAINGACAGVGLAYALQCDIRIAADGIKLTTAFSRRGLIGEYGMPWLLNQIAGRAVALDLLITARVILADEALRLGLVQQVVEGAELMATVTALARDIADNVSPASAAVIKHQVSTQAEMTAQQAMDQSDDLMRQSLTGPDVTEGIASFLERRPVQFPPLGQGTTFER